MKKNNVQFDMFAVADSKSDNPMGKPVVDLAGKQSEVNSHKRLGKFIGLVSIMHCGCPAFIEELRYESKDPRFGLSSSDVAGYRVCCNVCDVDTQIYHSLHRELVRMARITILDPGEAPKDA